MLKESELVDLKVSEGDAHLEGMKRYSEFLSLHRELLKSSSYARHVKGTKQEAVSTLHYVYMYNHWFPKYTHSHVMCIPNRCRTAREREGLQTCV